VRSNTWVSALGLGLALLWSPNLQAQLRQISVAQADLEAIEKRLNTVRFDRDYKKDLPEKTARLQADIATLGRHIDGQQFSGTLLTAAYMIRASAEGTLNRLYLYGDKPVDLALARQTLADYDKVIAAGQEKQVPAFANAAYEAGGVAGAMLQSQPLAYSYYAKCAEAGHAACTNIMAWAYITGAGGVKVDIQNALAMHKRTWQTGIEYNCAGSFSAGTIGLLTSITGQTFEGADSVGWFERAVELATQADKKAGNEKVCQSAGNYMDQYIARLARGETRPDLLDKVEAFGDPDSSPVLGLLRGRLDWEGFDKAVAAGPAGQACASRFYGLWIAVVRKETAAAQAQKIALYELPPERCENERGLARLMMK
jgi:hypothetical protein